MRLSNSTLKRLMNHYVVLFIFVFTHGVHSQPSTEGFISIDCGFNQDYIDSNTSIPYTTDDNYIDTGINYNVSYSYMLNQVRGQEYDLRSFPNGTRNCYTLEPVVQHNKYLIRATFYYGNYDGLNNSPQFDLYIGATNHWQTISITNASEVYVAEIYTLSVAEFMSMCLVNTGLGTPFINELELRPLSETLYPVVNITSALTLAFRYNFGSLNNNNTRYPDDLYDRIWNPVNGDPTLFTTIATSQTIQYLTVDTFMAPQAVLATALVPSTSSQLEFSWPAVAGQAFYFAFHMAELQLLNASANATRIFDILFDGAVVAESYEPTYLLDGFLYTKQPGAQLAYDIVLNMTWNSTLPPVANAVEVYTALAMSEVATEAGDVDALVKIKAQYGIKRNWAGDPCGPKQYPWEGVNCSYGLNNSRVNSLYLSSNGLNGTIIPSFSDLSDLLVLDLSRNSLTGEIPSSLGTLLSLQFLDLSYNNLTGAIPDSLGFLSSLRVLNLTGNNFTGPVPASLIKRSEEGSLLLRVDDNTSNSTDGTPSSHKKISTPIIIIIAVGAALLLLVLVLLILCLVWCCRRKPQEASTAAIPRGVTQPVSQPTQENVQLYHNIAEHQIIPAKFDGHEYNYQQLVNITNNFSRVIGRGDFGIVYHGYLPNGSQVAIKLHSHSGAQRIQEFVTKAQNLTKVHHRNLVSLVGYCADRKYLALIYEYMSQGSLEQHLRGKGGLSRVLTWHERLRIAVEVAEGLDYLHRGCLPPVIHKDIKTSNILLGNNLEAKITDFALSKSFLSKDDTEAVTVGTPGYMDPEFHSTYQLTEKSDVYSFGIVLLELITGQPAIQSGRHKINLVTWATSHVNSGNIDDIVDIRLQGDLENNESIWKVLDLSVKCTERISSQRPAMSDVLIQLKETLVLENAHRNRAVSTQPTPFEVDGRYSEHSRSSQ